MIKEVDHSEYVDGLVIKSGILGSRNVDEILSHPEDYIDSYFEFIGSAEGMLVYDQGIQDIWNEEIGGFYDGSRNLEDVCSVIASRAQLYIDEKG